VDALADYEKLDRPAADARRRLLHDAFGPEPRRIQVYLATVGGKALAYAITLETYRSSLALPTRRGAMAFASTTRFCSSG
jgi:hypothetical protein